MAKKVEVLANVAILITALILCSVLVKKYLVSEFDNQPSATTSQSVPSANQARRTATDVGSKISLDGIDWSKGERTVVVALSTSCRFCTESAPFYQQLEQKKARNVQLVAVLPQQVADSRSYLGRLNVRMDKVVQAALSSIRVTGTPTLLLVDKNGVVENLWVGKLSERDSQAVLRQIAQAK
ncbi:MAG TPA: redoxin family protein [Pyrinomonadaceae bacterium]